MPGQLDPNKSRISYAEFKDKIAAMRKLAGEKQVSMSFIIREAVDEYLEKRKAKQG